MDTGKNNVLLTQIGFELDVDGLLKRLHLDEQGSDAARVRELAAEAQAIGRPKVLYRAAYIDERGDDYVVVDGIRLTSRILRVNLENTYRVFPFVATCGRELKDWSDGISDMLESYWAGGIKEAVLGAAFRAFGEDLAGRFHPGRTSSMNPGSLEDWPMPEQKQLFRLLGDPEEAIGVTLSDSFLMVPVKSVSGLRFASETSFENCQLCPRERCPGRRAPYDRDLYERKYRSAVP